MAAEKAMDKCASWKQSLDIRGTSERHCVPVLYSNLPGGLANSHPASQQSNLARRSL